jgi:hypothetical protein
MDDVNGSLLERFRNGIPDSVDVRNEPTVARTDLLWTFTFRTPGRWDDSL